MDGTGFHVDIDALERAASGIDQSAATQAGSELSSLPTDERTYGHAGVADAMDNFTERWSDGLDVLTADARTIGRILGDAARAYRAADTGAAHRLPVDPAVRAVDD